MVANTRVPQRFIAPVLLLAVAVMLAVGLLFVPPWGPPCRTPGWSQVSQGVLALVTGLLLLSVYLRGAPGSSHRTSDSEPDRDRGWLWLALAMFTWTGAHLVAAVAPVQCGRDGGGREILDLVSSLASALNSMYFLFAAARLDDAGPAFRWLQRGNTLMKAGVFSATAIFLTALAAVAFGEENLGAWEIIPPFTLSLLTLGVYGWGLLATLVRRGMKGLAAVWAVGLGAQTVYEFLYLYPPGANFFPVVYALSTSAKSLICIGLAAQAISWVYEEAEQAIKANDPSVPADSPVLAVTHSPGSDDAINHPDEPEARPDVEPRRPDETARDPDDGTAPDDECPGPLTSTDDATPPLGPRTRRGGWDTQRFVEWLDHEMEERSTPQQEASQIDVAAAYKVDTRYFRIWKKEVPDGTPFESLPRKAAFAAMCSRAEINYRHFFPLPVNPEHGAA